MLRLLNCLARFKLTPNLSSSFSLINKNESTLKSNTHSAGRRFLTGFIHKRGPLYISEEVYERIQARLPVVALESTIITHGMSYPHNLETAQKVESIIRANGSVPATIGIIDGNILVGLQPPQLDHLAQKASLAKGKVYKVSRSDLPVVCELKACAGTTVSATSYLANLAGIRIFVTGGIGGVHRDVDTTMDISADLNELGQTPITVVSAGIKSILDIGKSLEVLETNGVCVAVYDGELNQDGQVMFPAFFTADSGFFVNYNLKTAQSVARIMLNRDQLELNAGILIAVPNFSEEGQNYNSKLENALNVATKEMSELNIRGKKVTPYLLARINELTGGESLKLNQQLIENNAKVGAQISLEYSRICKGESNRSEPGTTSPMSEKVLRGHQSPDRTKIGTKSSVDSNSCFTPAASPERLTQHNLSMSSESFPVVIGGSIFDIISKAYENSTIKLDGSTYPGKVQTSLGGVGRNISDAILRLGQRCMLVTAVGRDQQGHLVSTNNHNMITAGIRVLDDLPTSACSVTIGGDGECLLVLGDLRAHQFIDKQFVSQFERQLSQAPIVIMDSNVPLPTMDYVLQVCRHHRIPAETAQIDTTNVDTNSEGNFIHSARPTREFSQVSNAGPTAGLEPSLSTTSSFDFNYSLDKGSNQFYSHAQSSMSDFDSAGHLLSLTKRNPSATDYILHHSPFLATSSHDSRPQPSFESHYLPATTFADAPVNPSSQSSKVISLGLDAMAPLRYSQSNLFNQSSIHPDEHKLTSAGSQPGSSSPSLMSSHLSSPSFSAHYQLPYNSLSCRMYDMSGQHWKSMYHPPSVIAPETPHYLNPPPAHHNTTAGRLLSSSSHYSVTTPLVPTSSYLSPSISASESLGAPTSNDPIPTRKYTRSLNRPSQTTKNSDDYRLKRERNNIAVRKSREKAKRRLKDNECRAQDLIEENEQLRNRVKILSKMLHGLRMLLSTFGVSQEKINFEVTKSLSQEDIPNAAMANLIDPSLIKSSSDYFTAAPSSNRNY